MCTRGRPPGLLADGTVAPVWGWPAIPGLYSGKAGYPGVNIQIAATTASNLAAAGPVPRLPP